MGSSDGDSLEPLLQAFEPLSKQGSLARQPVVGRLVVNGVGEDARDLEPLEVAVDPEGEKRLILGRE